MRSIKNQKIKLLLVGSSSVNGVQLTMTLDSISNGKFVFKDPLEQNKKLEMAVDAEEAPEEFFCLHIQCSYSLITRLSCASMLQTSCMAFIRQCHEQGFIKDNRKEALESHIMSRGVYRDFDKQLEKLETSLSYKDGDCQSAYLREIMTKVSVTVLRVLDCLRLTFNHITGDKSLEYCRIGDLGKLSILDHSMLSNVSFC